MLRHHTFEEDLMDSDKSQDSSDKFPSIATLVSQLGALIVVFQQVHCLSSPSHIQMNRLSRH